MFWFVVVVGMEEYMEGRLVGEMVEEMVVYGGWNGENGQPKGCFWAAVDVYSKWRRKKK